MLYDNKNFQDYFKNSNYIEKDIPLFKSVQEWFRLYFSHKETSFDIPLLLQGTDFQKTVWNILMTIPYGKSVTYGSISKILSIFYHKPISAQAAGGAVKRNPLSIIIPCHRVIAADGYISGYAGGINRKRMLLDHENIEYII